MPAGGDLFNFLGIGQLALLIETLDGRAHAQVARSQHIGPPQREDQEHVRCPLSNTFDVRKSNHHLFVGQPMQIGKIHLAGKRMLRQVADVSDLLPGEASPAHLAHAKVLDSLWRDFPARSLLQPSVDGARSLAVELLKYNGPRQSFKRSLAVGNFAGANPSDDRGQYLV